MSKAMPCGDEKYPLTAYIWRRDSTQEWVMELSGAINDTSFTCRHTEPVSTCLEDVAGLPSLYTSQAETRRLALEEVEAQAEQIMLDVANEWYRQIGIDEVLKSKLVKRIADTVATGVFSKRLRSLIDQPSTEGGKVDG